MVDSPSDNIQTHKVLGRNSPRGRAGWEKSLDNSENLEKLSPGRGGGGDWGGRPLWDHSTYILQHRRNITQTFIVDSPNDALQTHKVSGPTSPKGLVGGQKSLENPEKVMKSCPSEAPGRALARTGAE